METAAESQVEHNMIEHRQSVKTYDLAKPKSQRLRWNLLWTVLLVGVGAAPCWVTLVAGCPTSLGMMSVLMVALDVPLWIATVFAWLSLVKVCKMHNGTDPELRHLPDIKLDSEGKFVKTTGAAEHRLGVTHNKEPSLTHFVVMVGYKEPLELMCKTIDTLAAQTLATKTIMVIGLEQRSSDYAEKIKFFKHRYGNCFLRLIQTVHPYALAGEIPGTASNVNWAVRQSTAIMRDAGLPLDPERTILTKLDTDTLFLPTFLETLEREFLDLDEAKRRDTVFQSILTYNLALDQRYFFTRVTGILRTFLMSGLLIPLNINPMSVYSISLSLARRSGYWRPHYQMEDMNVVLNLMVGTGKSVHICQVPLPTVCGPTSGGSLLEEMSEWCAQARRWTIGASEIFHLFVVKLSRKLFRTRVGLRYGVIFTSYYCVLLASLGPFFVASTVADFICACPDDLSSWQDEDRVGCAFISPRKLFLGLTCTKYVFVFGTAFFADVVHRRCTGVLEPSLGMRGGIAGVVRSLLHFASSLPVLLAYSTVATLAIAELSIRGREVCTHTPAQKTALVSHANTDTTKGKQETTSEAADEDEVSSVDSTPFKLVEMDLDLASDLDVASYRIVDLDVTSYRILDL